MATAGPVSEAEGGIQTWDKEKEGQEKEEEEEEETAVAAAGNEAPSSPNLPLAGKARAEGPAEVKPELHPLQNRWALWFLKNDRSRAWRDNLQLLTKVDTVEDFWALYRHVKLASKLSSGCDYALFKDGIEPTWEDSRNRRGGRWLVSLAKQQRHSELDQLWLETLLCLIGESFEEHSSEVCGAVISIRAKGDKIAVWTREAENQAAVLHIGRVYKERLGLSAKTVIGYQAHADTAAKSNSLTKNKLVV
ncbi:PREDICTED: eukaryotic translation initiation factor 4E type 1B [Propithecus coquereli]|uniref:eukaryotic translation initiation factor 4E type 1B n=1 Tax=Propithecus coquereli TaxID=379532 RepID=UPI00063F2F88|nr:PREDICTED: eukaryotic translation initiation factor 4E type 1B [Propithecus coquereli]